MRENVKADRGFDAIKKVASTGYVRSNLVLFRNASLSSVGNTALAHDHHEDHEHAVMERNGAPVSAAVAMERHGAPVSAGVAIAVEAQVTAAESAIVGATVAKAVDSRPRQDPRGPREGLRRRFLRRMRQLHPGPQWHLHEVQHLRQHQRLQLKSRSLS